MENKMELNIFQKKKKPKNLDMHSRKQRLS